MKLRKLLLAFLGLAALPAWAQQHPNVARGFGSSGSFNPGDVDSVNLFNGNLVIRIPLGQVYPVNGSLSYGLTLVYNNNVWDYQQDDPGGDGGTRIEALPNRTSNAGLGWTVSLGRLNPPGSMEVDSDRPVYMSPDGAFHSFYPTLHEGEAAVAGIHYTRDGTYLRYKEANSEIEMPDGTIQHFRFDGYPDQIRDRFGNQVTIAYTTNQWTISDGHRTQRVWFRTDVPPFNPVVDRVELAAFGNSLATWTFRYSFDDGQAPAVRTGCLNSEPTSANQVVPLLTRVTLPDGSFYSMAAGDYGIQTNAPCDSGMLHGVTLPTLGRIEWDYMEYVFPPASSTRTFRQKASGVSRRRLKDAGGLLGEWIYTTALTPDPFQLNPHELVNALVTPLGDKTVSYFSVSNGDGTTPAGWTSFEYGLPLTRYVTDGGSTTRYLSSQIFDCDPGAVNCQLKRTNFVAYHRDADGMPSGQEDRTRRNQRLFTRRTNYADSGLLDAVVYSNFDGLGHYREANLYGNYGSGDTRTTFVNYNPGQSYPGGFTPLAAGAPWVLHTYKEAAAGEPQGSALAWSEYCFDANTGFLLRTRTYASTGKTRSPNDVVMRYTPLQGNVVSEESFGGDGANLDVNSQVSLCDLALPANQYQTNYTYQFGSLKTAQSSPGINFKSIDRDIDASTGMTAKSRDTTALFATVYEYDALGRPTFVKPQQDAWTKIIYSHATSPASLAETYTARLANGGGAILAESKTLFDGLGRVRQEQQRMPDNTWSIRTLAYNALGWRTAVSEMGSGNQTLFLNYDPFGRPGIIRPSDGSSHDVNLTYSGNRSTTRTLKVATSYNTGTGVALETAASTTELYDRQQRLLQVTEPNGVITKYEYDFGGRLKRVCQAASGTTCGQERSFTYDARGFLLSEKHPEKGASGNGTVSYLNYDSRGHARQMIDGPHNLAYSYDRAERLFQIKESGGSQKLLKELVYANDNPPGNFRKGKVREAKRYNYPMVGGSTFTALITETYTYGGREGRVSSRDTQLSVNGGTNESFTQSFAWDELGHDQTLNYPQCTIAGAPGCATARTVTTGYTLGWLTSIPGYTGTVPGQAAGVGLTYHPNGLVKEVAQSNGVLLTQTNDPNGMARPASIAASRNGTTLWTTGTYRYDGSGNIWKTGTAWYEYDSLSRIKTGTIFPDPLGTGTQQKQSYSFDAYGNLQSITTQIGANPATTRNTPASASTNRLTGSVSYDAAGNLTSWNGALYEYDAFDQMWHMSSGSEDWIYVYTADDERIWSYNPALNTARWTLRDLDGKVLRDFSNANGVWSVAEDYIYRDGQLLAGYLGNGQRRFFALDHLGTPRLLTNASGNQAGYHVYFPFGEEATPFDPTIDRMQFTGHERDLNSLSGVNPFADDLDYMHARHYNAQVGRFTAIDPIGGSLGAPQSWNRYAYVMGNPLKFTDPTGMDSVNVGAVDCNCFTLSNDTSINLSGFYNFLYTSFNFFTGGANALSSNFLFGAGRYNATDPSYRTGQSVGDFLSFFAGLQEALDGGVIAGGGAALDATGVGAVLGVPANAIGGAMIVQGGTASALGAVHFMEGMKRGGSGGRGAKDRWKSTDALRRHNKVVGDVVTKLKLTKDQRRMLHDRVHGEQLTFHEVLEIARDMFKK